MPHEMAKRISCQGPSVNFAVPQVNTETDVNTDNDALTEPEIIKELTKRKIGGSTEDKKKVVLDNYKSRLQVKERLVSLGTSTEIVDRYMLIASEPASEKSIKSMSLTILAKAIYKLHIVYKEFCASNNCARGVSCLITKFLGPVNTMVVLAKQSIFLGREDSIKNATVNIPSVERERLFL